MNKASISKKTLSVFLSVLMLLSCCVTATPWLADTFGLKASADTVSEAQWSALDAALNTWAGTSDNTYQRRNALFHVAEKLQSVLNTYVVVDPGTAVFKVTGETTWQWQGITSSANFLADMRTLLSNRYSSEQTKYNLLISLIPDNVTNDGYDGGSPWGKAQKKTSYPDWPSLDDSYENGKTVTRESSREIKDALLEVTSFESIPDNVKIKATITYGMDLQKGEDMIEREWYETNYRGRGAYYRFTSKPSLSYEQPSIAQTYKKDLVDFSNYFTSSLIQQDPFAAFANLDEARTAVQNNQDAFDAFWTDSNRWSESNNTDKLIVNQLGGQYTTVAGDTVSSMAYLAAVKAYMAACEDTLHYYTAKGYVQNINALRDNPENPAHDREALWFIDGNDGNKVRNTSAAGLTPYKRPDGSYRPWTDGTTISHSGTIASTQVLLAYNTIQTNLNNIEELFPDKGTKGYQKLGTVDDYSYDDVYDLCRMLKDYYDYYSLQDYKDVIDGYIAEYEIPVAGGVDVTAGSYKYRDLEAVSDTQIDIIYGYFCGYVKTLNTDNTYSSHVRFYVFGNTDRNDTPDVGYVTTARDYLAYEVQRRGMVSEFAPIMEALMPYVNANLVSFTPNQILERIEKDQNIYEGTFNVVDGEGNPVEFQHNKWENGQVLYGDDGKPIKWNPYTASYPYNYIHVYEQFINNPIVRADEIALIDPFNRNVQEYIKGLYQQLSNILIERVTQAMEVTEGARDDLTVDLDTFSYIKASVDRVRNFNTSKTKVLNAGTDQETTVPVSVYEFLHQGKMYRQTAVNNNDGYPQGPFTEVTLDFLSTVHISPYYTDSNGVTSNHDWSFETAYHELMTGQFMANYTAFVESGGLNGFTQRHYYDETTGKFTKDIAYMVRKPQPTDLGRGNDTEANDTYTVTNVMVGGGANTQGLVQQLDTFLASTDMVHILSNFIDDDGMKNLTLSEYVMKLLGEKLFTDEIMNKLVGLAYPKITQALEDLWRDLDNTDLNIPVVGGHLHTTSDDAESIYNIANALGLYVYPNTLANSINLSTYPQLASAKQKLAACGTAAKYNEAQLWTNVINANSDEEGNLTLDWGVNSIEKLESETYVTWFTRRAGRFKDALSAVLGGLNDILLALFADKTYNQTANLEDVLKAGVFGANIKELTIEGMRGYSRVIVPILETLGCDRGVLSPNQATANTSSGGQLTNTAKIVSAILDPIIYLVTDKVADAPVATILDLLPNLLYFLSFDKVDELLSTLTVKLNGKVTANIPIISLFSIKLTTILGLVGTFASGIKEKISWDDNWVYLNIYKLIGINSINEKIEAVDISDINAILKLVLESAAKLDLDMPIINVGSVLRSASLNRTAPSLALNENNGSTTRILFTADKADMFYDIISWVGDAFHNESFISQMVALITKSNDQQDQIVEDLLIGVRNAGTASFVLGLVELFQPKARTVGAKTLTYKAADYIWYGASSAKNYGDGEAQQMANKGISKFLYVAYQNEWTYVKANTFVENADTIITKLLENQLREREVNSFGEWLLSYINLAWSNEAITTVMRLLVTLGNATKNELITYIIGRFTENGMDLSQWYQAFGYLFPEIVEEPVQAVDNEGHPVVDADGNPVYVQATDDHGEPAVDDDGNPIYEMAVPAKLIPGNPGYTSVFGKLTAAVDPDFEEEEEGEGGLNLNSNQTSNKKYIWTYDGTELKLGDRATFQTILSYMLAGGDTTNPAYKGGMMPAIDIFLSGATGKLFKQPNGTALLTIYGSNGYDSFIVPFFEALGMNELLEESDFVGFATSVGLAETSFVHGKFMLKQSEFDSIASEQKKVEYLFNVAFGFLEKIMEPELVVDGEGHPVYVQQIDDHGNPVVDDHGDPVYVQETDDQGNPVVDGEGHPVYVQQKLYNKFVKDVFTTVLPSLLYFLQSNGLSVGVRNLLQPVLTIVDDLLPIVDMDVDKLLNQLVGRFVLPLLGKEREIALDENNQPKLWNPIINKDGTVTPRKNKDGSIRYEYVDDYGIVLKDLSFHKLAEIIENLIGINLDPLIYGLDAICSAIDPNFVYSASEASTNALWNGSALVPDKPLTGAGHREGNYKTTFLNGSYQSFTQPASGEYSTFTDESGRTVYVQDVNDPANVITILLSLVLDLVLADSKTPAKVVQTDDDGNPVTDADGNPVYVTDGQGNPVYQVDANGDPVYLTNAELVIEFIKGFASDSAILDLIPTIISAIRELGFTTAWTITPNWSYFDDIDRGPEDHRTVADLILEANANGGMINTPVRTIYYLRYAENFAPIADSTGKTNLWSRSLATYLDTSLADLVDWIIGDFVAKDGSTLGQYVEKLLTGDGGVINKALINKINAALRDNIGGAVDKFAELLNIFVSFDIHFWDEDPYPELNTPTDPDDPAEPEAPYTLTQFGTDLARLFTPLNEVLTWLLAGNQVAMFHSYQTTGGYTEWVMDADDRPSDYGDIKDLIKLPGGQGYWVALVPLLEMLGIELPQNAAGTGPKYLRDGEDDPIPGRIYYMDGETKKYASGVEILSDVIVCVLSQVEGWMRGEDPLGLGDNLIDIVLNRLANVIYFLNANGLVTVVVNLLSPLAPLANALVPLLYKTIGVPDQKPGESDSDFEKRKFITLVDNLLDELLYTETTITQVDPDTGELVDVVEKTPLLPPSFSILDLNLYNIFEAIKEIVGLDINGAVNSTFYVNGMDDSDGTVEYNYLKNFFLGEISMRPSANGDMYFRMDFNDEESRADFITILLYTAMDVLNSAKVSPTSPNNEFFVSILGKTDEVDENGDPVIDYVLGQTKLNDLWNMLHAKVSGYEGYDWFYFDKEAREAYYARLPEAQYSASLQQKLEQILTALNSGSYQVDWNDTTMAYLLTGYLNYTDTNLWDEDTARAVEARFGEIVDLLIKELIAKDNTATVGSYLTGLLESLQLKSNKYIVMLGSLLGNLLKNVPARVTELLSAAVPGFDATYWNQYAGKAVADEDHPAGTYETDEETGEITVEYVPLVEYDTDEDFVNAFVGLFEPFGYLLDWLLVGQNKGLELFYVVEQEDPLNDAPAISIGGANGFKEGLVPLLEALGLKFNAADVNDPDLTGIDCVKLTLSSLLTWVDGLLNAEDGEGNNNTVGAFVDLLPNIIYFINANGLTVTVLNTLRSLTNVLELASGLLKSSAGDITNLNTLLGLDKMGIDLYDLSLEGICNIVKGLTAKSGEDGYEGLEIIKAVSIPETHEVQKTDDEGHLLFNEETGEPIMETVTEYNSYLKQWAIGKVSTNTESALYPERSIYRMDFTYTREELAAFGAEWADDLSKEERARRMERINIFTVLICSVIDVFKYGGNEDFLKSVLGEDIYNLIDTILNLTAGEIHYEPYNWFYFSDTINSDDTFTAAMTDVPTAIDPETGVVTETKPGVLVPYLDTTPASLIYKYGYFDYYRHDAGEGNLWNANSVGYLKDNFYNLIDTVIQLVTKYDESAGTGYATAGAFIADKWNGLNLYSTENLYKVGYAVGNLLGTFEGVLDLALGILLGQNSMGGKWDEYLLHRVTDDPSLVDQPVVDDEGQALEYKGEPVTYVLNVKNMGRTAFIDKLVDIFKPADFLISWFLVGADTPLEFLYTKQGTAAISLTGGNGYDEALVPIIEALGCDLSDSDAYFASAEGGKSGINVVKYAADKLLGRVDNIAASENPVREIVAMIPNLIYFINANGLSVSVRNLIAPVVGLLGVVNSFVDTGDIGEIQSVEGLIAFALSMLQDSLDVDFDLTTIDITDLSISGVFNLLKAILGVDINAAMTFPRMTLDDEGNPVVYHPGGDENAVELINIYEQLAIGMVTRFTSANGKIAYRMDACADKAALSQIDMIAVLMATVVNLFEAKDSSSNYINEEALVKLFNGFGSAANPVDGQAIFDAIIAILNLQEGSYVDYEWLFTLRTADKHLPYLDPTYQNVYVSPIDRMSSISGTAGYDRYWTKEMAQYVADNLVKVVNNVLLLIGISIPGIDGPINSIEDLINGFIPGGNLYTNELFGKLVKLIVGDGQTGEDGKVDTGLLGKLDEIDPQGAIKGLLKDVLGIDLTKMEAYRNKNGVYFTPDGDRDAFVNELAKFLSPVDPLLEWLFTDKPISLFYNYDASDLIKLPGGNGYEQAVIPLFEAVIGYNNPNIKSLAQYKADIAANPNNILIDILNPLLDFVDAALADPLNVILDRIPAIVYFINSKAADRMVKNLLSPVYQVLNALNTLVEIDIDSFIKDAIGFSLEELDFNAIIDVVIGLLPENLSSLSPLIVDAVKEFTIGKVIQYPSKAVFHTDLGFTYMYGFTMELDKTSGSSGGVTVNGSQNATLADLITILLRAVIKWLTMPENQETVVNFLNENIENEAVRTYVLNAYGVDADTLGNINTGLIGFRYTPYGVSQMMALLYYVFFAANLGSSAAISAVQQYGNYWPYVSGVLTNVVASNSALSFLSGFITYLSGLVERVNGQNNQGGDNGGGNTTPPVNEDTDGPGTGSIGDVIDDISQGGGNNGGNKNFFQKILDWFASLFDRIRRFFTFG